MTTSEKLNLYSKFTEGCELEDAVHNLICGASVLNGINCDHETQLVVLVIHKLIYDSIDWYMTSEQDWDSYSEINPELYSFMRNGARKLTEEEYCGRYPNNS